MLEMLDENPDVSSADLENAWQVLNSTFAAAKKERPYIVRKPRRKFRDKDYVYVYDKDSQCGTRSFWRCERKSECPARIHTDARSGDVVQYLKDHNHPPPDDSSVFEKPKSEVLTSDIVKAEPVDVFDSTTLQLNSFIQTQLDGSQKEVAHEDSRQGNTTDEDSHTAQSSSPNQADDKLRAIRKRRRCSKEDDLLLELSTQPLLFWEAYASTKHIINWLKNGGTMIRDAPEYKEPIDKEVENFLAESKLKDYSSQLARYSMPVLLRLSQPECVSALGSSADGLLLYHQLQIYKEGKMPATSTDLTIFVGKLVKGNKEVLYHAITLKEKTETELLELLKENKIVDANCETLSVHTTPPGVNVLVNNTVISCWKPNSAYQITVDKTTAKMSPVNSTN